ncbi:MAG: DUF234 domain-containing protein [Epsilonproteobacteria bacterium]|nr:DUF234 domain-containing protein [Campylobacterota bacterium]
MWYNTNKKVILKTFSKEFPYLETTELISYYAVFNGYPSLAQLHKYETLLENIKYNILDHYQALQPYFIFSDDQKIQQDIETLLFRIAVGNRKIYSIYKNDISQFHGSSLYQILFQKKIITKELSREKPLRTHPSHPIKKAFRRYQIEDKIIFTKSFYRFWFTFITPNRELLEAREIDTLLEKISTELDKYISRTFEILSNELLLYKFGVDTIIESGSYWDKHIELDILAKTIDGKVIAGECKWKNQKISKNTLNKLQKKCQLAELNVDYYALFSKSGFSNELLKMKAQNILLYDIASFKGLTDAG